MSATHTVQFNCTMLTGILLVLTLDVAGVQAQTPRTVRFAAGPLTAAVTFGDARVAQLEPEVRKLLTGALQRYHDLFAGPPLGLNGNRLNTIQVSLTSAAVGEGEADAGSVRVVVGERPVFGFYDWRLTLLHETFHLWSAESFRYAGGSEQWFNEGIAEFYALQTAARLELIDPLQAVNVTATALGFYESASNLGTLSLVAAAANPQLKFRNYFLVYAGGWMAGLVLDHDIRSRTRGQRSLDDLLRRMYQTFQGRQRLYTTPDIVVALRAATGLDQSAFFRQHIQGPAPIPVARHLSLGNLAFALTARVAGRSSSAVDSFLVASLGLDRHVQ